MEFGGLSIANDSRVSHEDPEQAGLTSKVP